MKRLLLSALVALVVGGSASVAAPQVAQANDWDVRYRAYRNHWDDHWRWRNRYYQPYYHHYYYSDPYYHRRYSAYPRTYYYRPHYDYYYGSPYGYRDYRHGGSVRVGPLRFYWR